MKEIINISLGLSRDDYAFKTNFLGQDLHIQRLGADGDLEKAADLLLRWSRKADAIGLGSIKFPYMLGDNRLMEEETGRLQSLGAQMQTPVTTGDTLRLVTHEWALRYIQYKLGDNYFNNARVFFFSGRVNAKLAQVMSEYTDNLTFADPVLENGVPKLLNAIEELETYMQRLHRVLQMLPGKHLSERSSLLRQGNASLIRKGLRDASVVVVPYHDFYRYMERTTSKDLEGKILITSTAYDDRIDFLKQRGLDVVIDTTPMILDRVVGVSVLEAMMIAALGKPMEKILDEDLLEIINELRMEPRILYPSGETRRTNRFAFVIYPRSREDLKRLNPIDALSRVASPPMMDALEKLIAFAPPVVYTKLSGVESPAGTKSEGWIISLGITPEEMLQRDPEFTRKRLLDAAVLAKKLGAQIMGIATLPKAVSDVAVGVAKEAVLPVTAGNNYIASSALWAAAEAVRRMGLINLEKGKILKAKTMVVGATGAVGAICSRLLAMAFEEVHLIGRNTAKLLALQASILEESPTAKLHISTKANKFFRDMDVIVAASSGAGRVLSIRELKPGCVLVDMTRPLILSPEQVAQRPDVLVIKSGEILLPGDVVRMKEIGLPQGVVYADLAETIVLALEGRYEAYTTGSRTEWEKVREIYRLGLKHGMQLAVISGVNGVITGTDIDKVRECALEARSGKKKRPPSKRGRKRPTPRATK